MKKTILLSIITLFCVSFQAFSATYYVRMSTNTSDWSTKTNVVNYVAGTDFAAIINAYAASDVVWMAKGTYTIGTTMLPKTGMTIAGGFAGNESSLANRPKSDLDGNGFTEAWEFTNATEFVNTTPSITFNAITMKTVTNVTIDGISVKGFSTLGISYLIYIAGNADGCMFKNSIIKNNTLLTSTSTVIRSTFYANNGIVQSCLFQGNTVQSTYAAGANAFAGGLALYGGYDTPTSTGSPQAIGCVIRGNIAKNVKGANSRAGGVTLNATSSNFTPALINCLVYNNETEGQGGGVYIGGAGATSEIINCTIVKNKAKTTGGGVFHNDTGVLLNSIIWGNLNSVTYPNDIFYNNASPSNYTNNYLAYGLKSKQNATLDFPALTDTISLTSGAIANNSTDSTAIIRAPKFVNPTTFVGVPVDAGQITAMEKANFQIIQASPCVNFADNSTLNLLNITTDLLGNNRFFNTTADLGAYESVPGTGINDIRFDYKVYSSNNHIVLSGLPVGQMLAVYDFAGQIIKSMKISDSNTSIAIAKGLYLVRVANQATKVIVQ